MNPWQYTCCDVYLPSINDFEPLLPVRLFCFMNDCSHFACEFCCLSLSRVSWKVIKLVSKVTYMSSLSFQLFEVVIPPAFGVQTWIAEWDDVILGYDTLDNISEVRDLLMKFLCRENVSSQKKNSQMLCQTIVKQGSVDRVKISSLGSRWFGDWKLYLYNDQEVVSKWWTQWSINVIENYKVYLRVELPDIIWSGQGSSTSSMSWFAKRSRSGWMNSLGELRCLLLTTSHSRWQWLKSSSYII